LAVVSEDDQQQDEGQGRRAAGSAALLVVLLSSLFQIGSALAVKVVADVGVLSATWLRQVFSALLLAGLGLALRRQRLRLPPRGRRLVMLFLVLSLLGMNLAFYAAVSRAPVGIVVTIEFLGPLAVAVLGTRRPIDWLWIVLAGAGVFLLAGPTGSAGGTGIIFAFLSGACWAAYLLLAKHSVTGQDPLVVTTLMIGGSALLLTPVFLIWGTPVSGYGHAVALSMVVALASGLPYFLELVALRRVRAATYGVLVSIEPALAALAGFLILGQALTWLEVAAIGAVVAAAAGASWTAAPEALPPDMPEPPA
jgi:inner membrane transporter RhtA